MTHMRAPWIVALLSAATIAGCVQDGATPATVPAADSAAGEHRHSDEDVSHYTCPMHPSVRSAVPGRCPICGMDLTPVSRRDADSGAITLDASRRQTIGVETAPVERRSLDVTVRAVGRVVYDETRLTDVSLKLGGWIGELYANSQGQFVRQGEPLFTVYSPDLYAAQSELLAAAVSQTAARETAVPARVDYLVDASRRRLRLWDLSEAQIDQILRRGRALEYVPILSPISGYVIEKNVVRGGSIEPGARLFRIAELDRVWVEAEIYESDLGLVMVGDTVVVKLPYVRGRTFSGTIAFVYPYLDQGARTGRVRVSLENPDLELKPDMYADVEIEKSLGDRLVIAHDAVLAAGRRSFVFVDLGEGRLQPRAIEVGRRAGEWVEVLDGLAVGEVVVTSGNFLVAAESRLRLDMEHWK